MAARTAFTTVLAGFGEDAPLPIAARLFAQAGMPVFPCAPGGKNPLTEHGFHDATTSLAQVESWWRRFPAANIGMPTGVASGVVVVDVDVHGVNGYDAFRQARRAGLVNGWEALVRSPTGGLHVYYPSGNGEQPSWQAGRAGIDLRGDLGYIIVPPSRRIIGGATAWYRLASLSPTPGRALDAAALRTFLDPPRPPRRLQERGSSSGRTDPLKLAKWLGGERTDRNHKLFWASCVLAEEGVPYRDALDAMLTVSQPDFGQREIARTVASGYKRIHGDASHPRNADTARPGPVHDLDAIPEGRVPSRGLR
ncbi:Bifunctional DNA primase/polymerase, N-terminal [Brevibacterium aurantiacum]|uniref:Bifunctional DNA primase/polymerase, N-terminal n=1 Tax=Brevibacterium aurantiacum TaxID=273384 RepID=A0A2H1JK45_BREAU|nr:bifunctional DNA primase/polymerase [Brevibacterium aurantiacum]SMX87915.1 Bifunctional DNA primase/polymerase, N-terminal [Brevibacterium aurantiacum]